MLATTTSRGSVVSTARPSVESGCRRRGRGSASRASGARGRRRSGPCRAARRARRRGSRAGRRRGPSRRASAEQPPADEVAREVLLPDLELSPLPLVADFPQRREDRAPAEPSRARTRRTPRRGSACTLASSYACTAASRRSGASVEQPLRGTFLRERAAGRLGGGSPPRARASFARPARRPRGVEAKTALRPDRLQQLVAALPGAEELRADAHTASELADPQGSDSDAHPDNYTYIGQKFDRAIRQAVRLRP